MKLTRRGFLTAAASSLIVAPELLREGLLDVDRTFFLPGPNGWIQPLARMVVPTRDIWMWEAGIAAGQFTHDPVTEMLSLWRRSEPQLASRIPEKVALISIDGVPQPWTVADATLSSGTYGPPLIHV